MRSNYPYGVVDGEATYTSTNGAKFGSCTAAANHGWSGQCFEPNDMCAKPPAHPWPAPVTHHARVPDHRYKGEVARAYFYISVAYAGLAIARSSG